MKKLLIPLIIFLLIIVSVKGLQYKLNKDIAQPVIMPKENLSIITPSPAASLSAESSSIFVPYWTIPDNITSLNKFQQVIYFGIKPDDNGIDIEDIGMRHIVKFNQKISSDTQKWLALRMLNSEANIKILNDEPLKQKIIDQTIDIAERNNMQGIVLDLEIAAIPFESLTEQINDFARAFYASCRKHSLAFSIVLFGDSYYRARPYDIKTLAANADRIMIMAYDLHKAKGNPGPNFPISGKDKFGYDLNSMIIDYLQVAPPEKITIIFGLFGYDWPVDDKNNSLNQANALSLSQIQNKFINNCDFVKCEIYRDIDSSESRIRYVDRDNVAHIVWYDDMESVKRKKEFFMRHGINSFSFWAYSFFNTDSLTNGY